MSLAILDVFDAKKTLTAHWPWVPNIGQNIKSYTSNGDVSIWAKIPNWDVLVTPKP